MGVLLSLVALMREVSSAPPVGRLRELPTPLTRFPILPAEEADEQLKDDELVLGVEVNGQSRAYPINMITRPQREVVNDNLGGRPIAATWCQLCFNGIVYSRKVRERTYTFHVYGKWNDGLVFRDVETESIWSQLLGRAIRGPLRGTSLRALPSTVTQWKTWRDRHPATTVVVLPRLATRYTRAVYDGVEPLVLGLSMNNRQRHYPFTELMTSPVANDTFQGKRLVLVFGTKSYTAVCFEATLDGQSLTFEMRDNRLVDRETGSRWDSLTGRAFDGPLKGSRLKQVPAVVSYRVDWLRFYPHSSTWTAAPVHVQSDHGFEASHDQR